MYFQKFPYTYYTLDDKKTVQVITNILLRTKIDDLVKNNFSYYDLYDVKDGETPEIVAYNYYGDSNLHWVILMMNEILDPRYDWPLDPEQLNDYTLSVWKSADGIHHYEDENGNEINGNVQVNGGSFDGYTAGQVIYNSSGIGKGFITSVPTSTSLIVTATEGGFKTGDVISNNPMGTNKVTITSTVPIAGTPVTNFLYEDSVNESKRRIKLVKPAYVSGLSLALDNKLSE